MDFTTMTDEELSNHLNVVLAEQERRQSLANIPGQIQELTNRFIAGGGNPEDLS